MSKALVVDDSRAIRRMLSQIMTDSGFEVVQASNGKQALQTMEQDGFAVNVVMVDWNMPEMDGLEFVQSMRTRPALAHVPVVMVTTQNEMEQIATALQAGANEYVMKPFTAAVIQDKLRLLGVMK